MSLPERTERLLKQVEDWPLGVATDYLIDAGFSVLGGVRIVGRGRVARLKLRLKAVIEEMVGEPLQRFKVQKDTRCANLAFWWDVNRADLADGLDVTLHPRTLGLFVSRGWRQSHYYTLCEWCAASAGEFAERSLCDLFVLLWCLARCYSGD